MDTTEMKSNGTAEFVNDTKYRYKMVPETKRSVDITLPGVDQEKPPSPKKTSTAGHVNYEQINQINFNT